jgi:hypothetical protein
MREVSFKVEGVDPGLLMHNIQMADPTNEYVKEIKKISKKRNKSEEELIELARLEFLGGLYLNRKDKPIIPGRVWEAAICNGAKKQKLGKVCKSSVFCHEDSILKYNGPQDINKRVKDPSCRLYSAVSIGTSKVMRCRPLFEGWSATVNLQIDTDQIDVSNVEEALNVSGKVIGICDYRPRYGRFEVLKLGAVR